MRAREKGSSPGRVEGSSRAMLSTARPSCYHLSICVTQLRSCVTLRYWMTIALLWQRDRARHLSVEILQLQNISPYRVALFA